MRAVLVFEVEDLLDVLDVPRRHVAAHEAGDGGNVLLGARRAVFIFLCLSAQQGTHLVEVHVQSVLALQTAQSCCCCR